MGEREWTLGMLLGLSAVEMQNITSSLKQVVVLEKEEEKLSDFSHVNYLKDFLHPRKYRYFVKCEENSFHCGTLPWRERLEISSSTP